MEINQCTYDIIGAAMEVHRQLGPGLLESVYEECLCKELLLRKISFKRQDPLPVSYKGTCLESGYKLDLLVANQVIVELKAVEEVLPIHKAQLLTYLKVGNKKAGLLLNFNVANLQDGIVRMVNKL